MSGPVERAQSLTEAKGHQPRRRGVNGMHPWQGSKQPVFTSSSSKVSDISASAAYGTSVGIAGAVEVGKQRMAVHESRERKTNRNT